MWKVIVVRYTIDQVREDMVLGESIVLPSGELLLAAGYRVKARYRERLKQLGFRNVLIDVEGTESVTPNDVVSEAAQREMSQSIDSSSKELSNAIEHFRIKSTDKIKEILKENKQYLNKFIMNNGMAKALDKFVEEIMSQSSIVLNLSAMQQTQPSLLGHALNVTITSLCIGKKYKLSYEEMKQLGIGALNYELGLIALPKELLEKKVTEYNSEELKDYKQHTVYDFLCFLRIMLSPQPVLLLLCSITKDKMEQVTLRE